MIEYTVKVFENGDLHWYLNDKLHREDGPAIEWVCGYKAWYLNGVRHREDGPAIENVEGIVAWYLGDVKIVDTLLSEKQSGFSAWYLNGEEVRYEKVGKNSI